jgi:hypothetical protein
MSQQRFQDPDDWQPGEVVAAPTPAIEEPPAPPDPTASELKAIAIAHERRAQVNFRTDLTTLSHR